jgi:anaerobic sulfite reductase subunit B
VIDELLVPRPYRVIGHRAAAPDVWTLTVAPVDGAPPTFLPAQVSMLGAFGVGEAAISISSGVDDHGFQEYTIRDAGPITHALVTTPVGDEITVRGPFGRPWPLDDVDTPDLLVVAGGLGIAPLRALLLAASTRDFEHLTLVYGARSPEDLVFADEFDDWRRAGIDVRLTVDHPADGWDGPVGFVSDHLEGALSGAPTTAFVCGPDPMMRVTAERLVDLGVPAENVWLTMERNMQCGNALCGHCQLGPMIVCRDGPVANYADISRYLGIREL